MTNQPHTQIIPIITIDGPGGSGKGTIGQLLARTLKWHFLDSGAVYRVLALAAENQKVPLNDAQALANLAKGLDLHFIEKEVGSGLVVMLAGEDVTEAIRTETCGNTTSKISALPEVRSALLERQRAFRKLPGLVTDGRDMGTVVFPEAQFKIFLLASVEERASRRYRQLKELGINVSLPDLCNELAERDRRDRERPVSPLQPAADAVIIDTTQMGIEEVFQQVKRMAEECFKGSI